MNKYKVVHIINNDKFIKSFIDFVEKNFDRTEHLFIFLYGSNEKDFPIPIADNIININNLFVGKKNFLKLSKNLTSYVEQADKVILHSLFSFDLINYLYLNQKFLKKCYWMIWGGDLYTHALSKKTFRIAFGRYRMKIVISRMRGIITYMRGTYGLAQKWYGATGEYYECFLYPSNLYELHDIKQKKHTGINLQLGNSANQTNNHLEILEILEKLMKDKDINVFVPLSYGSSQEYIQKVKIKGGELFGDKFKPLVNVINFKEYLEFLAEIDVAIFAHKRQQGMGNIITLLGLGKKIYIRNDIPSWKLFEDIGVKVFDVKDIDLCPLDDNDRQNNQKIIKEYFSKNNYRKQLKNLFEG